MTPAQIDTRVANIARIRCRDELDGYRAEAVKRGLFPAEVTALHDADKRIGGLI